MPIYEYLARGAKNCEHCATRFEVVQRMDDKALKKCPQCGAPIERVFSAPSVHGQDMLSNKSLGDKGFTKYVKAGDGYYEKKAGKGPNVIKR